MNVISLDQDDPCAGEANLGGLERKGQGVKKYVLGKGGRGGGQKITQQQNREEMKLFLKKLPVNEGGRGAHIP